MDVVGAHLAVADHPVAGELKAGNAKVDYGHIRCYHLPDAKREISTIGIRYDRWGQTASWIRRRIGRSRRRAAGERRTAQRRRLSGAPAGAVRPEGGRGRLCLADRSRAEEQPSELKSLMRSSFVVFCLKK